MDDKESGVGNNETMREILKARYDAPSVGEETVTSLHRSKNGDRKVHAPYDYKEAAAVSTVKFWEESRSDNPNTLNGFEGTFDISEHELIPPVLHSFIIQKFDIQEQYRSKYKDLIKTIPMEKINAALNEVWDGVGSMAIITQKTYDIRLARQEGTYVE